MNRNALFIGLGYLMVALLGCGTQPMQSLEPTCVTGSDVQAAMDSAEQVLGQMHFTIDKSDSKQGYIRTKPLTGAQLFEFWRKDTVGQFNMAESNLHTVRRTVEINVSQKNGQVCTDCVVTAERMSLPQREAVSTSQASALFTRSSPSLQQLELNPAQQKGMTWIELGRDSRLEAEILSRLRAKL
ncbi:MAG: hypothetical protein V3T31_08365 [candidate division Zixibacteria bacterium]